jgi:hypothetical protein
LTIKSAQHITTKSWKPESKSQEKIP